MLQRFLDNERPSYIIKVVYNESDGKQKSRSFPVHDYITETETANLYAARAIWKLASEPKQDVDLQGEQVAALCVSRKFYLDYCDRRERDPDDEICEDTVFPAECDLYTKTDEALESLDDRPKKRSGNPVHIIDFHIKWLPAYHALCPTSTEPFDRFLKHLYTEYDVTYKPSQVSRLPTLKQMLFFDMFDEGDVGEYDEGNLHFRPVLPKSEREIPSWRIQPDAWKSYCCQTDEYLFSSLLKRKRAERDAGIISDDEDDDDEMAYFFRLMPHMCTEFKIAETAHRLEELVVLVELFDWFGCEVKHWKHIILYITNYHRPFSALDLVTLSHLQRIMAKANVSADDSTLDMTIAAIKSLNYSVKPVAVPGLYLADGNGGGGGEKLRSYLQTFGVRHQFPGFSNANENTDIAHFLGGFVCEFMIDGKSMLSFMEETAELFNMAGLEIQCPSDECYCAHTTEATLTPYHGKEQQQIQPVQSYLDPKVEFDEVDSEEMTTVIGISGQEWRELVEKRRKLQEDRDIANAIVYKDVTAWDFSFGLIRDFRYVDIMTFGMCDEFDSDNEGMPVPTWTEKIKLRSLNTSLSIDWKIDETEQLIIVFAFTRAGKKAASQRKVPAIKFEVGVVNATRDLCSINTSDDTRHQDHLPFPCSESVELTNYFERAPTQIKWLEIEKEETHETNTRQFQYTCTWSLNLKKLRQGTGRRFAFASDMPLEKEGYIPPQLFIRGGVYFEENKTDNVE